MGRFASFLGRLLGRRGSVPRGPNGSEDTAELRWTTAGGRLDVTLFVGDLVDAPAEALCTSTNPRLSLGGGTGRAVMAETGWSLRRDLQRIAEEEARRTGAAELPVGFTCATPGGEPPHRLIVHCVASEGEHHSSPRAVRLCVEGALREADRAECTSLALPVFGTGHADLPFHDGIEALAEALRDADPTAVRTILVVLHVSDRVPVARAILERVLGGS